MNKNMLLAISTAAALSLAACGGSDSAPAATAAASILSGTAAVGAPIVGGTVNVTCAAGSALNTSTNTSGGWQVTLSGQTLPCAIQVANGTVNGVAQSSPYHSIAVTLGVINITPLTDLVIANLSAQAPGTWFGGLNGTKLQTINQNAVNTALNNINSALGLTSTLAGNNPLTTAFSPVNGNLLDDILEALANAGATHANLLTLAQLPAFSAPSGFNFQTAFAALNATPTTPTTPTTPITPGTSNLTVSVTVSGLAATSFAIANVPTPSNQSEFCSEIQNDSTFSQIGASGGGTLTINSCSFANKVGTLSATLAITSPISMTVPYTVIYTYQ